MALLGGVLLDVVTSDDSDRTSQVTQKATEEAESFADHVKHNPTTLSISGYVLGDDAAARLTKLEDFQKKATLLTYVHRLKFDNLVIESFGSNHGVEVRNGFAFNMRLVRVRFTKPSPIKGMALPQRVQAKSVSNKGRQQVKTGQPKISAETEAKASFLSRKGLE